MNVKEEFHQYILDLQISICKAMESIDGRSIFLQDEWVRPEGGGGLSCVISGGQIFEKGGVNTSAVFGKLPETMQQAFGVGESKFFACGLSLVIHPLNPFIPTVHANWRYFELYNESSEKTDSWFGGGSDLTPFYVFEEDGKHFHSTLKKAMDAFGTDWYPKCKQHCDEYFINRHRNNEARGIGGVFYDYLRPKNEEEAKQLLSFQKANGNAFLQAYMPIVERRQDFAYGEREIHWQEIRRGRYVEFNLIHDRGTLFGLKTNGRTESILMSLPPRARWEYNFQPEPGSREAETVEMLKPRDWVNVKI
jgi:coproporphyrinogen III oxidase